jgi:hypothetical protein
LELYLLSCDSISASDLLSQLLTKAVLELRAQFCPLNFVFISGGNLEAMITQKDFDKFVESYNTDYYHLLSRASTGNYNCLITSFTVLKDLYDMINKLHDVTHLEFRIIPFPLSFRANDDFLRGLGFDERQIGAIYGFLDHVRETQGKDFEDCLDGKVSFRCVAAT